MIFLPHSFMYKCIYFWIIHILNINYQILGYIIIYVLRWELIWSSLVTICIAHYSITITLTISLTFFISISTLISNSIYKLFSIWQFFWSGNRLFFWDPGSIISQELVYFQTAGLKKLIMVAPQLQYRGSVNSTSYKKSFADSIYWSSDVSTFVHSFSV